MAVFDTFKCFIHNFFSIRDSRGWGKIDYVDFGLKSKTPSVIPFWRAFFMPMKGARSKVPLSGHFK